MLLPSKSLNGAEGMPIASYVPLSWPNRNAEALTSGSAGSIMLTLVAMKESMMHPSGVNDAGVRMLPSINRRTVARALMSPVR